MTSDSKPLARELPSVSVVVAAYNAAAVIDDCLRSLLELNYPGERLELIVVDNDSSDATASIVRRIAPGVRLLHEKQRGAGAARNRGVAAAHGEIIAFTDSDCVVDPRWLVRLVAGLSDTRVGIAGGRIRALRPCSKLAELGEDIHDHGRAMASRPSYAITMNWASPKRVLDELGGFNTALLRCQDVELTFRIVQAGYALEYVDDAVIYHRNRATLAAVLREAQLHGRGSLTVRRLHAGYLSEFPPRPRYLRRIYGLLRRLRDWRHFDRVMFGLVFDLGKIVGELRGELPDPTGDDVRSETR